MASAPHSDIHAKPTQAGREYETVNLGGIVFNSLAGSTAAYDSNIEWRSIDPSTPASFGAACDYVISDSAFHLKAMALEIGLSALGGTYTGSSYANFAPTPWLVERVEIWANNGSSLLQTLTSEEIFVHETLHLTPREEVLHNALTKPAGQAAQTVYLPIHSVIDQADGLPLYVLSGDVRIRVHWRGLQQAYFTDATTTPGSEDTGAATGSIVSSRLLIRVEDLNQDEKMAVQAVHSKPVAYRVNVPRVQRFSLANGATSGSAQLTGVQGHVSHAVGLIRPANAVRGDLENLTAVTSFNYKSSTGESIVGHQELKMVFARLMSLDLWSSDNMATSSLIPYSWAEHPEQAVASGSNTGGWPFKGSETINLIMPALGAASDLYVISYVYGWLEVNRGQAKVLV